MQSTSKSKQDSQKYKINTLKLTYFKLLADLLDSRHDHELIHPLLPATKGVYRGGTQQIRLNIFDLHYVLM